MLHDVFITNDDVKNFGPLSLGLCEYIQLTDNRPDRARQALASCIFVPFVYFRLCILLASLYLSSHTFRRECLVRYLRMSFISGYVHQSQTMHS